MKKKILLLSVSLMSLGILAGCSNKESKWDVKDKTVIIYTSNIRGNVDCLPQVAGLFDDVVAKGGDAILVDVGNFIQGTKYTTYDSGESMVKLMKSVGYSTLTIGSHEFDFGNGKVGVEQHEVFFEDGTLGKILEDNKMNGLSSNVKVDDKQAYSDSKVITTSDNKKVGFVGVTDPNTVNYVLESSISNLTFDGGDALVTDVNTVMGGIDADYKFILSNAGNLQLSSFANADYLIDVNANKGFTVGAVAIDGKGKISTKIFDDINSYNNENVAAEVKTFKDKVEAEDAFKTVFKSEVTLNGSTQDNRSKETNLGDFWTDAMLWYVNNVDCKVGEDKYTFEVDKDHLVAAWNGGNLRDYLREGDVTMKDLQRVLPYPNKLAVVYVTGSELVEFLEAASQGLPFKAETNDSLAAFMQVAGIKYSIDTSKEYNKGDAYGKFWFKDNEVGTRVSINEINGKAFSLTDTYGLIVSNAVANGMDSNYICATEGRKKQVLDVVVRDSVMSYIKDGLNGTITNKAYGETKNRIEVK